MSTEEKNETLADKAKAQIDALKTKEGRDALKDKAKDGVEGAKKLWDAASIVQRVVVLVAVVLVTIFLTRSCGSNPPAAVAANDTQQGNPKQDEKAATKVVGPVDLTKADSKTDSLKSFVGFEFGTSVDKFKDVEEVRTTGFAPDQKVLMYYKATPNLKSKFRLFDFAVLKFTREDKRLYKIVIQTPAEKLVGFKPTAILKEAQYCAAIIEKKYGARFSNRNSNLYVGIGNSGGIDSNVIGSHRYSNPNGFGLGSNDSDYAILPSAYYHGFFNNTIEVRCTCGEIGGGKDAYLGITITAMDHGVIEEEGGRTKDIPLDADDDEGNL